MRNDDRPLKNIIIVKHYKRIYYDDGTFEDIQDWEDFKKQEG